MIIRNLSLMSECKKKRFLLSCSELFVNDLMLREGLLTWEVLFGRAVFKWASWVARLQTVDSSWMTLHVYCIPGGFKALSCRAMAAS